MSLALLKIYRCLAACSTEVCNVRMSILKDILSYWVQGKVVFVGEHVSIETPNATAPNSPSIKYVEDIQQAELTSSTSDDCVSSQTQVLPSVPSTSQSCSTSVDDPNENNETGDFHGTMFANYSREKRLSKR